MSLRKLSRLRFMSEHPGANGEKGEAAVPARPLVGSVLRSERERRGFSLDDVAAYLRIRRLHLEAIESSRFQALPGAPYAVGFVRAYADFLELDRDEIVRCFRAEASGLESRKELTFPRPLGESRLPGGVVLLISALIAVGAYGVWYMQSTANREPLPRVAAVPERLAPLADPLPARLPEPTQAVAAIEPAAVASEPVAEPPAAAEPVVAVSPPAPTPPVVAIAPVIAPAPPAIAVAPPVAAPPRSEDPPAPPAETTPARVYGETTGQSRVVLRATADSWIQVRDDGGNIVFARVLRLGDSYNVPNRRGLMLHTGNAGALDVQVDGKAAPPVGRLGVVKRDISLDPDRLLSGSSDLSRPSANTPGSAPPPLPHSGASGG